MFDMELDVAVEGTLVSKLLDDLMVESFNHLKSCQDAGRLDEVCHQMVLHQQIYLSFHYLCGRCIHLFGLCYSWFWRRCL